MDRRAREIVQSSYETISPHIEAIVRSFYDTLFSASPETARLFPADMDAQVRHMSTALAMLARNVHDIDSLTDPIRKLGARHTQYGVLPHHYALVRAALISTLARHRGSEWTRREQLAWESLIDRVASLMQEGAMEASVTEAARRRRESSQDLRRPQW